MIDNNACFFSPHEVQQYKLAILNVTKLAVMNFNNLQWLK